MTTHENEDYDRDSRPDPDAEYWRMIGELGERVYEDELWEQEG